MIKINKRLMAGIVSSIMSVAMLAGCASKPKEDSADNSSAQGSNEVNIYSARHYDVDKELFKKFEEETGIKVNLIEGKADELIERMAREGEKSSADVFLTVGAENIYALEEKNLIQKTSSEIIDKNIPEKFRGENWVGLTSRARVIAYDKDRVNPEAIKTYDDLLDEKYNGKVLVRSSSSSYNVALLASFIQENGEDAAKEWATGILNNFARTPEGNDRDQVKAIAAGTGDVAIVNSYYLAKMINSSDVSEVEAAKNIGLIFPENTHVNLSFAAVANSAKNKENAIKLIEFLTAEEAQSSYANENGEFPLNKNVQLPELLKSWGEFNIQDIDFEELGAFKQKAVLIFDQIGWK